MPNSESLFGEWVFLYLQTKVLSSIIFSRRVPIFYQHKTPIIAWKEVTFGTYEMVESSSNLFHNIYIWQQQNEENSQKEDENTMHHIKTTKMAATM